MTTTIIHQAKKALETEIFAGIIYQYLAITSREENSRKAFTRLAEMENLHVHFWKEFLKKRNETTEHIKPSNYRIGLYKTMLGLLGKALTLQIMENNENRTIESYSIIQTSPALDENEKHGLKKVLSDELVHENFITQEETKLEGFTLYIKDAVLGMSDGLVEILSVTTGLAGASGSTLAVAISGLVVAVAGGLSMGISTYTSSRSQRQVHEGTLKRILTASKFVGHVFKARILTHLIKRGYSQKLSQDMAEETSSNNTLMAEVIAEQDYGLKQEHFVNPMKSALYAGLANLIAGLIPLVPYFLLSDITIAMIISVILATISLAVTGFFVSILAFLPPHTKIMEMIVTGLGTSIITFGIGKTASILLGTS